ncbi:hypothetical protein J5N97_012999 [Dioscorea zingiberensis]|uniref:Protein IRON-RELATED TRANSCRIPTION FACTOR 2 n=1 Tax=Dioscorea zingiberensis TaxID=325984 RepID=A0A9D5CQ04_9LILI|nr:hypothetical protein J5N97_012999 [Dioscorea zingiberensis]
MLALCPHKLSSTTGMQLEEAMIHELHCKCPVVRFPPKEAGASYNHFDHGFSPDQPDLDFDDLGFPISPTIHDSSNMTKKLSHNAYERDRRKKLNGLYSSLRSLLPETEQNKKLSIPCTISRVLKYIPELQRQVQRLSQKKEEMLLNKSRERRRAGLASHSDQFEIHPVISAACLNNKQVMMQICIFNKQTTRIPLSKILRVLEGQGLQLMDASTSTTDSDQTFYSLHLQAKETINMDFHIFCDHLITVVKDQSSSLASSNICNGGI